MNKFIKTALSFTLCCCTLLSLFGCSATPNNTPTAPSTNLETTKPEEKPENKYPNLVPFATEYSGKITDAVNDYFIADGFLYYIRTDKEIQEIRKVKGSEIIFAGNDKRIFTGYSNHLYITKDEDNNAFMYVGEVIADCDANGVRFDLLGRGYLERGVLTLCYIDNTWTTYNYNGTLQKIKDDGDPMPEIVSLPCSLRLGIPEFRIKDERTLTHKGYGDLEYMEFVLPEGVVVSDIKSMSYSRERNYRVLLQTDDNIYYYNNRNKDYTFVLNEELTNFYKENPDMKLLNITQTGNHDTMLIMAQNSLYIYNDPNRVS